MGETVKADATIAYPHGNREEYLANQTCFWKISLPENSTDKVRFAKFNFLAFRKFEISQKQCSLQIIYLDWKFFDIEEGPYCSHDNLTIYDGMSDNSSDIGSYCNSKRPYGCRGCETIRSSGRHLFMILRTNAIDQRRGFRVFAYGGDPTCMLT